MRRDPGGGVKGGVGGVDDDGVGMGMDKKSMVGPRGLEPLTSRM